MLDRERHRSAPWVALALLVVGSRVAGAQNTQGLAIAPGMVGGDATEKLIFEYLGGRPEVDKIIVPEDAEDLLQTLLKMGRTKAIKSLIIAGHGAKANPSVLLAKGVLLPDDVDMDYQCTGMWSYRRIVAENRAKGMDATMAERQAATYESRARLLRELGGVMARDGSILMLNCSTFASPRGKSFVVNLGKVLLSQNGGTIRASKSDIGIGQVEDYLDVLYGYATRRHDRGEADHWVEGDWETVPIAAAGPDPRPLCPEPPRKDVGRLVLLEETLEVLDPAARIMVKGKTGSTPTSRWQLDSGRFSFHSTKDDFDLQVFWSHPPGRLAALEQFPFSVYAYSTGGPRLAEVVIVPVVDVAGWRLELADGNGAANPGPNAFRLALGQDTGTAVRREASMDVRVTAVGRGASVRDFGRGWYRQAVHRGEARPLRRLPSHPAAQQLGRGHLDPCSGGLATARHEVSHGVPGQRGGGSDGTGASRATCCRR